MFLETTQCYGTMRWDLFWGKKNQIECYRGGGLTIVNLSLCHIIEHSMAKEFISSSFTLSFPFDWISLIFIKYTCKATTMMFVFVSNDDWNIVQLISVGLTLSLIAFFATLLLTLFKMKTRRCHLDIYDIIMIESTISSSHPNKTPTAKLTNEA
jgi:hypothetical protein